MEEADTAKLTELLNFPRPLTASASASFSLPFPPTSRSPTPKPPRRSDHRILTALNRPSVIIGTLTLPNHLSSSFPCSCFRFSDGSATVCCDILNFRVTAVGKEIRVVAWNFIPFKHHGNRHGFLEIINWSLSNPPEESNLADSLPLVPPLSRRNHGGNNSRAVHGIVDSVGPVSVVPCGKTSSGSNLNLNSNSIVNLTGFLVQLVSCECVLCSSRELMKSLKSNSFSIENRKDHSFTKMDIVYFCGDASSFHPVMTKLIGNRVVFSGLKKKLVYMNKEESCLMYVTVDESVLQVCLRSEKLALFLKSEVKGKGECGCYTGVVKGVYMRGMALELDHDVWLLLTDELHTLIHGLRVGSIVDICEKCSFCGSKVLVDKNNYSWCLHQD